jgi:hypothetical protein
VVFVASLGGVPGFSRLIAAEVEFIAPSILVRVGDEVVVSGMNVSGIEVRGGMVGEGKRRTFR